ncbi:MAG: IS3 family transposase [Raoultibacter sp.]
MPTSKRGYIPFWKNSTQAHERARHPPSQRRKGRYNSYKKQERQPEPNIIQRNFKSSEVCEKMVSDVTEFQVAGQKVYLSPLIDLFNGEVVGRSVSMSPTVNFVNKMFEGVTDRVPLWVRPTVHTDQGLQYWHKNYKEQLMKIKALQSMSRKSNCQDNAPAESFFGHLKSEFFYRESFKSVSQFIVKLDDYIDWYNNERIRCGLNGMSPVEYRQYHEAMG